MPGAGSGSPAGPAPGGSRASGGRRLDLLLAALVFALALWPRLAGPTPFVTWDEPNWAWRSLRFEAALARGEPGETYLSPHPGVITMLAAAPFIAWALRDGPMETREAPRHADRLQLVPYDEDDPAQLAALAEWVRVARPGIAVLSALLVALAVPMLIGLVGRPAALAGAMLMAFDPWLVAHGRLLHLDAALTGLMTLSALALLVALSHQRRRYALLSGALAGAALLEKSPAAALLPFAVLAVAAWASRPGLSPHAPAPRRAVAAAAGMLAPWACGAGAAFVALWPAMWARPGLTLARLWAYATESAGGGREAVFWWGRVQPDPGLGLYLTALAWRLTPLALVGLVAATAWLVGRRRGDGATAGARAACLGLLAFAALFVASMGSSGKKFERYVLPVVPAADIVAGVGLTVLAGGVARRTRGGGSTTAADRRGTHRRPTNAPTGASPGRPDQEPPSGRSRLLATALLAGVLAIQSASVLAHSPYYLAWYNPLLGGGPAAARVLPVGWGEGMDLAAAWLDGRPSARDLVVATPSVTLLAALVQGTVVGARDWQEAHYVVVYIDDVQIGEPDLVRTVRASWSPAHVVRLNGIDYAWIYRRPGARLP